MDESFSCMQLGPTHTKAVDTYLLLPSFWHGMKPDERRLYVATVRKYQGYSIDCLKELRDVCSIPIKDMQHLRVCIECAKEHAKQLDRDAPDADTIVVAKSNPAIIFEDRCCGTF
jgi:hypothetical protein